MSLFVDTSVWSLAFRRDEASDRREVEQLHRALEGADLVFTTGIVLQELLQGFRGPKAAQTILDHFGVLPLILPTRDDHVEAAGLRNRCRRRGLRIGTIDALLAALCIHHDLTLLTTDADFHGMARHTDLVVW